MIFLGGWCGNLGILEFELLFMFSRLMDVFSYRFISDWKVSFVLNLRI